MYNFLVKVLLRTGRQANGRTPASNSMSPSLFDAGDNNTELSEWQMINSFFNIHLLYSIGVLSPI